MHPETESVLDRRRMRRKLSRWRAIGVTGVALAIGAYALGTGSLSDYVAQKQIARVAIEGTIIENRDQLSMLKRIKDAAYVKGVIVYVNSPGGTTTGGEALYEALREIAKKKPVVAQFGTVAASAGYIVGLGTDHIVARGNTVTGSIGVLAQWPEFSSLLDKIGVKVNEVKSGELKAAPSLFAPMTEPARRVMEDTINDGFRWFLSLVEDRRKVTTSSIPGLTEGRIFSGREALSNGLVDQIGGEEEARKWLEDKRGVDKDLTVVDWKPASGGPWGLSSARTTGGGLFGGAGDLARLFVQESGLERLGLDGLVSVWHPSEN